MSIKFKIIGAFIIVVALGLSLVVVRSYYVNQMIDKVHEQYQLVRTASVFVETSNIADVQLKTQLNNSIDSIYAKGTEIIEIGEAGDRVAVIMTIFVVAAILAVAVVITWWIGKKIHFYENILDNIPCALSITDMNMKTTFINKPVEDMLKITRHDAMGRHCAEVWHAKICNSPECGVKCLERGTTSTTFDQGGANFKVDVAYLTDSKKRKIGHIETVQVITDLMQAQDSQAVLINNVRSMSDTFSSISAELTAETKTNADTAAEAAKLAGKIKANVEKNSVQMAKLMQAVTEINEANHSIINVTHAINDIARRTNILALNASVEAARGGEQGRSFAVVAEEIRSLAIQSASQVKDTEALIQDSIAKAELGAEIASVTAGSLEEIVEGINKSNAYIGEIAQSSELQSSAINELHNGVEKISMILGDN